MQRKCRELKCDRCGESVLLEKTDTHEGYGVEIDIFQDPPAGWSTFNGSDLCPECTKKLEHLMNGFFERSEIVAEAEEEDLDAVKNALLTLKRVCAAHQYCSGCPFDVYSGLTGGSKCYLYGKNPMMYDETLAFRE